MDLAWWSEVEYPPHDQFPARRFRFGRRTASVSTDDSGFGERFLEFFRDCLEPARDEAHSPGKIGLRVSDFGRQDAVLAEVSEHDYDPDPSVI